ncbi:hypothetical protein FA10DRAFT_253280 [Acaromyces ingoldii]|uniref:MI domain-containing protein n=1 Tax=Acaromyces ingoldii TaxID=215250 RepID=A0A316YN79_9BASI|nr:hypothetical protein FA10DRAFT_253280 [Acaromyces ingoldii]PWN89205.1 hypothetical protein FA10DRAFT_253280 [Acaromyces ingoldii]
MNGRTGKSLQDKKSASTTTLPAVLREELGLGSPRPSGGTGRPVNASRSGRGGRGGRGGGAGRPQTARTGSGSRKDARRAQREGKKEARRQHFGGAAGGSGKSLSSSHIEGREAANGGRGSQLKVIGKGRSALAGMEGARMRREREETKRKEKEERQAQEKKEIEKANRDAKGKRKAHLEPDGMERKEEKKSRKSVQFADDVELAEDKSATKEEEDSGRQRKHVGQGEMTPLERMLARAGQGSSGSAAEEVGATGGKDGKKKARRRMLTTAEKNEEDEIAWLEAKLGMRGKSKKSVKKGNVAGEEDDDEAAEDDDGLGGFLDELDRFYPGMYSGSEGDDEEDDNGESDEEEDLSEDEEDADTDSEDFVEESEEGSSDEEDDLEGDQESDDESLSGDGDEEEDISADDKGEEEQGLAESREEHDHDVHSGDVAKEQTASTRYIPPALRKANAASSNVPSLEQQKLRRQLKGLLNRLGDGNIDTILGEIEGVYRQSSRAEVTTCLTDLIIETVASSANLIDTFVILYAALTASLHRVVGLEFGASFVQTLVEKWLGHVEKVRGIKSDSILDEGKECINLLVLLGHLYNLSVVACPLVYDIVRHILGVTRGETAPEGTMLEVDVEMLLKLMRVCGPQLRHDDPSSLRSIIHLAQQRTTNASSTSSRARFMIEALQDLKNNRTKATANDASVQSLARMKKYLSSLSKKHAVRTQEPLRVTLDDLRDAEKKGRWWLVGAAWAGHARDEESGLGSNIDRSKKQARQQSEGEQDEEMERLLALAKRQGMNTDARRSIFLVLLQSQDYLDASRRLLALRLNETQRRETIRVLLHCIGAEKSFNPYYALVGQQLAIDDGGAKFTMQYCLWDFLRSLGQKECGGKSFSVDDDEEGDGFDHDGQEQSSTKVENVARAYAWWFAKGSISLYVLKPIDFTALKPKSTTFLQLLFIHLLLSVQSTSPALTLSLSRLADARARDEEAEVKGTPDQRAALESLFVRGLATNTVLTRGLALFVQQNVAGKAPKMARDRLGADKVSVARLKWALGIVKQVLSVGVEVAR